MSNLAKFDISKEKAKQPTKGGNKIQAKAVAPANGGSLKKNLAAVYASTQARKHDFTNANEYSQTCDLHSKIQQVFCSAQEKAKQDSWDFNMFEKIAKVINDDKVPTVDPEMLEALYYKEGDSYPMIRCKLEIFTLMHAAAVKYAKELGTADTLTKELEAAIERKDKELVGLRDDANKAIDEAKKAKAQYTLLQREFDGYKTNFERLSAELDTKDEIIETLRSDLTTLTNQQKASQDKVLEKRNSDLLIELGNDLTQPPEKQGDLLDSLMSTPSVGSEQKTKKRSRLQKNSAKASPAKKQKTALTELPSAQDDLFGCFTDSQIEID